MSPTAFRPSKTIGETIVAYRQHRPDSSCEEITTYVKKHFPGCNTNPASVACTLGKAAKKLNDARLNPGRVAKTQELPSLDNINNVHVEEHAESEEDAKKRIFTRYKAMERMVPKLVDGQLTSLIISGPPGIGKNWTTDSYMAASGRMRHDGLTNVGGGGPMTVTDEDTGDRISSPGYYDHIKGGCTAVGLYHSLWNMRNGGVIVFDDCDSIFRDEDSLNLLKGATDTTREHLVSWRKNATWLDDFEIDKTFDFRGRIVFLTNIDFEAVVNRGHPSAEHFKALIDRSAYLCLTLRDARDFMIVLEWKAGGKDGFLKHEPYNLTQPQVEELFEFVRERQRQFYNLSLRLVGQIALMMKADPDYWRADVEATKMRTI